MRRFRRTLSVALSCLFLVGSSLLLEPEAMAKKHHHHHHHKAKHRHRHHRKHR